MGREVREFKIGIYFYL